MSSAAAMHASNPYHSNQIHAPQAFAAVSHPVIIAYLYWILGIFRAHRFYLGRPLTGVIWFFTGVLYLLTGALLGVGLVYDLLTLNDQIDDLNRRS